MDTVPPPSQITIMQMEIHCKYAMHGKLVWHDLMSTT